MLPSGGARLFDNRVGWSKTHLTQAGLLSSPRRAFSVITPRGMDVLKANRKRVALQVLKQFATTENVESANGHPKNHRITPNRLIPRPLRRFWRMHISRSDDKSNQNYCVNLWTVRPCQLTASSRL